MAIVRRNGQPYFYRSFRRGGRVTSEYLGAGMPAALMARFEAAYRQRTEDKRADWKAERERMEAEDRTVAEMFDRVETIGRAAMFAAGFHRHKRQWRKRRG